MTALDAVWSHQSWSKVADVAPTREELLPPCAALGAAQGSSSPSEKPLRVPLLITVVVSYRASGKVPRWGQEAVASGVAHMLSLLLDEAGWGVIWRTGELTRTPEVSAAHGLGADEALLGWLYVGGKPTHPRPPQGGPRGPCSPGCRAARAPKTAVRHRNAARSPAGGNPGRARRRREGPQEEKRRTERRMPEDGGKPAATDAP